MNFNNYTSINTNTNTISSNSSSSSSSSSSNRCVYTGISMGIIEYAYLLKNYNLQLSNKELYEYENDHKHHYVFTVENLHSSQISLHRILGNQANSCIFFSSYVYSVSYVYPVSLVYSSLSITYRMFMFHHILTLYRD